MGSPQKSEFRVPVPRKEILEDCSSEMVRHAFFGIVLMAVLSAAVYWTHRLEQDVAALKQSVEQTTRDLAPYSE